MQRLSSRNRAAPRSMRAQVLAGTQGHAGNLRVTRQTLAPVQTARDAFEQRVQRGVAHHTRFVVAQCLQGVGDARQQAMFVRLGARHARSSQAGSR